VVQYASKQTKIIQSKASIDDIDNSSSTCKSLCRWRSNYAIINYYDL